MGRMRHTFPVGMPSINRKTPLLPQLQEIDPDDPLRWAVLFTERRRRKRWSYVQLATEAGVSDVTTIRACTTGRCSSSTLLKLAHALDVVIITPRPLTMYEAQFGLTSRS